MFMRVMKAGVVLLCEMLVLFSTPVRADNNCDAILKYGIMDEDTFVRDASLKSSFEQALCDTDFGTYQEARSYGIGLGVPVYGVPVEFTGSFDDAKKKEWYRQHCDASKSHVDCKEFVLNRVRHVNPTVVDAWSRCMSALVDANSTGLACGMVNPDVNVVLFSAEWRKAYDADTGSPVTFMKGHGGVCENENPPRDWSKKVVLQCKRNSVKDSMMFVLQAGKSQCVIALPGYDDSCAEKRFPRGETVLDGTTQVNCKRIVFEDGAVVRIPHGGKLILAARESIVSLGTATIDGSGVWGAVGSPGRSIGGEWKSHGDNDYWDALNDCRSNESNSAHGGPGGQGGKGGPGAQIILSKIPSGTLVIKTNGGPGGPGGPGGTGRLFKNGRNFYCNGCTMNCPSGANGPVGPIGEPGQVLNLEDEARVQAIRPAKQ